MMHTGCKSYMKLKYGITQPGIESSATLLNFLNKNHFPVYNQYLIRDSSAFFMLMKDAEVSRNLLSHMLFSRQGMLLERDTTKCQWAGSKEIEMLHPDSIGYRIKPFRLQDLTAFIIPFGAGDAKRFTPDEPDFTLVILWAKFIGRYNYRLFDLEKAVERNAASRIRIIYLNMDMQESWHLSKSEGLKIKDL